MERTVDVATGESVAFTYELAGLGSRFYAVMIDLTIQTGVVVVAFALLLWAALAINAHAPAKLPPPGQLDKVASAILTGLLVFAGFLLFFGYFIFFEWRYNGRTPGKRLLGIRVVRDGGFPVDFTAAVVRNVVRILEAALGFYAVSAAITLLSPENRRLGDMAAGTIVVRDNRYERAPAFASLRREREPDVLVRALSTEQRELVLRYYERRPGLGAAARATVAAHIAASVRPQLAVAFDHLDDDDLLVHLATTALQ